MPFDRKNINWCQTLSPNGQVFAWVGRHHQDLHEQAKVCSVARQGVRQTCTGLRGAARLLGFSPAGRLLAGGSDDGTIPIKEVQQE